MNKIKEYIKQNPATSILVVVYVLSARKAAKDRAVLHAKTLEMMRENTDNYQRLVDGYLFNDIVKNMGRKD